MDAVRGRKKILILDKDVEIGKLYAIILSEEFEVFQAVSAQEMKQKFFDTVFDLFIIGHQFPPATSLDLIRSEPTLFSGKPIIMITGDDVRTIARKAYQLGVSALLQKPYGISELLNKVRDCLRDREC